MLGGGIQEGDRTNESAPKWQPHAVSQMPTAHLRYGLGGSARRGPGHTLVGTSLVFEGCVCAVQRCAAAITGTGSE